MTAIALATFELNGPSKGHEAPWRRTKKNRICGVMSQNNPVFLDALQQCNCGARTRQPIGADHAAAQSNGVGPPQGYKLAMSISAYEHTSSRQKMRVRSVFDLRAVVLPSPLVWSAAVTAEKCLMCSSRCAIAAAVGRNLFANPLVSLGSLHGWGARVVIALLCIAHPTEHLKPHMCRSSRGSTSCSAQETRQ